jgi:hypothetical protein
MLSFLECYQGCVSKVVASGVLTRADHVAFLDHLRELFGKRGKVRVLIELKDFRGWGGRAGWDDPTLQLRYEDAVSRLAIVGEAKDHSWMDLMAQPFANVRYFHPEEWDEAWRWATEGVEGDDKECIRRLAYARWEAAGRPEGDGVPFWLEAEHELLGACKG